MIRLLTVCTGNICRSPFAERMLQAELETLRPSLFSVQSAGTEAMVGHGMEAESAQLLRNLGGSSDGFVASQLVPSTLTDSDLVLTMTVTHRDAVIRMSPRMLKKAYTLVEFARILRAIRVAKSLDIISGSTDERVQKRWAELPGLATLFRANSNPSQASYDVVDPYRRSPGTHQRMVQEIMPAIEEIVAFERWCAQRP